MCQPSPAQPSPAQLRAQLCGIAGMPGQLAERCWLRANPAANSAAAARCAPFRQLCISCCCILQLIIVFIGLQNGCSIQLRTHAYTQSSTAVTDCYQSIGTSFRGSCRTGKHSCLWLPAALPACLPAVPCSMALVAKQRGRLAPSWHGMCLVCAGCSHDSATWAFTPQAARRVAMR